MTTNLTHEQIMDKDPFELIGFLHETVEKSVLPFSGFDTENATPAAKMAIALSMSYLLAMPKYALMYQINPEIIDQIASHMTCFFIMGVVLDRAGVVTPSDVSL